MRSLVETKMKKISEAGKPTEIFFAISPGKHGVLSEVGAVNAAAFRSADFIHQRELECAVAIGGCVQARGIDIVAEADSKLLVVETGAKDEGIHQFAGFEFVGYTRPNTQLEGLVVAAAVAQEKFERVAGIHLERRALEKRHDTRYQAHALANHKFAAGVESKLAVQRNILVVERLVGAVEVAECAAKVEIIVFVEDAEPHDTGRHVEEHKVRIVDGLGSTAGSAIVAVVVVLARPFQGSAVDAALAHTQVGAKYQVMGFAAVATHFLGIRAGQAPLQGSKFRFAGFIPPEGAAHAEIVITAYRNFLVVRSGIRIVGILFQHGRPLVAVVGHDTLVAVHHTRHGRVEIERAHVKLREVDVLRLNCHSRQHREAQDSKNV